MRLRVALLLLVVVVVIVAVVAYVGLRSAPGFLSPLSPLTPLTADPTLPSQEYGTGAGGAESPIYLPLILKSRRLTPDPRFGIAEHSLVQMLLLGFPNDGRYKWVQHEQPEETDTVRGLRPASRDHHSTWALGTFDVESGRWTDEEGFRQFVREHDGMIYIVGNELGVATPIGDNNVNASQYARWYDAAWRLIKTENPTARVGPFAPVNIDAKNRLRDVWAEYQSLVGEPMPVDFFPVHHHVVPETWTLAGEIAALTEWINWLDSYVGRGWRWTGEPAYWLTEYSLSEWSHPGLDSDDVLSFMEGFTGWLKTNRLGIEVFVWWSSGKHTQLVSGSRVTEAGRLYLELALR